MKNKKAQEMSTGAIALIILAVIVLVVLVLGFSLGWNKILPWLKSSNLDSITSACSIACTTGNTYDFCSFPRDVKDGTNPKFSASCTQLASGNAPNAKDKEGTLLTEAAIKAYGITTCSSVTC